MIWFIIWNCSFAYPWTRCTGWCLTRARWQRISVGGNASRNGAGHFFFILFWNMSSWNVILPCQERLPHTHDIWIHYTSMRNPPLFSHEWCSHRRDVAIVEIVSNCLLEASKRFEHKQNVMHTDLSNCLCLKQLLASNCYFLCIRPMSYHYCALYFSIRCRDHAHISLAK